MKCCCGMRLIGPWWSAFHSEFQCRAYMPTGDENFVTVYDAYPIPPSMPDVEYIHGESVAVTPFKYARKEW